MAKFKLQFPEMVDLILVWLIMGFTVVYVNLIFNREGLERLGVLPAREKPSLANMAGLLILGLTGPVLLSNPSFRMGFRVMALWVRIRIGKWWRKHFRR